MFPHLPPKALAYRETVQIDESNSNKSVSDASRQNIEDSVVLENSANERVEPDTPYTIGQPWHNRDNPQTLEEEQYNQRLETEDYNNYHCCHSINTVLRQQTSGKEFMKAEYKRLADEEKKLYEKYCDRVLGEARIQPRVPGEPPGLLVNRVELDLISMLHSPTKSPRFKTLEELIVEDQSKVPEPILFHTRRQQASDSYYVPTNPLDVAEFQRVRFVRSIKGQREHLELVTSHKISDYLSGENKWKSLTDILTEKLNNLKN